MRKNSVPVLAMILWLFALSFAQAQESLDNLPLPRWASLAASEVNLRTGPGKRYPIDWVLKKKNLPVEITREFENWRMVREPQGATGWVHRSMLTSVRYAMVQQDEQTLHANPSDQSPVIARIRKGVIVRVRDCRAVWCRVTVETFDGWIHAKNLWGIYPAESID